MSGNDSRTRLTWLLLALLAALSLVLGSLILNGARSNWGPVDHPQIFHHGAERVELGEQ